MKKYIITLEGKQYEVDVEEVKVETTNVSTVNTQSKDIDSKDLHKLKHIIAPMPGNIISIHVNEGDTIKKGQVLMVYESMKMQNDILSDFNGVLVKINTVVGKIVGAGEILFYIE